METFPNNETGALFVNGPLDYESIQSYAITLIVENVANGTGPVCPSSIMDSPMDCTFSQTVLLDFNVMDTNDNVPQFTKATYTGGKCAMLLLLMYIRTCRGE